MKETVQSKRVHHKLYGEGVITGLRDGIITVQFQNEEKCFVIPGAFQSGFLTTEDEALLKCVEEEAKRKEPNAPQELKTEKAVPQKSNGTKTPVVFCNIMWQERYDGSDEKGINGGSYVKENGTGNEYMNFLPFEVQENGSDTFKEALLGSFETKSKQGRANETRIERILGCRARKSDDWVDGVTVVWCATSPWGTGRVVGWYQNATVYRTYQGALIHEPDGSAWERWYNIKCDCEDAVLLPVKTRYARVWDVPRAKKQDGQPFGFGRANIWYASEPEAQEYVKSILSNIEQYTGENLLQECQ